VKLTREQILARTREPRLAGALCAVGVSRHRAFLWAGRVNFYTRLLFTGPVLHVRDAVQGFWQCYQDSSLEHFGARVAVLGRLVHFLAYSVMAVRFFAGVPGQILRAQALALEYRRAFRRV
jgi:hypothetical protein